MKKIMASDTAQKAKLYGVIGGAALGTLGLLNMLTPVFIQIMPGRQYQKRTESPDSPVKIQADQRRRQKLLTHIYYNYLTKGDGKIDWYEFADIVDVVAREAPNDDDFRDDLWYLFGWRDHNAYRSPLAKFLDNTNTGLPQHLKNSDWSGNILYHKDQFYHYLGGTTGNDDWIPSHIQNSVPYAWIYELKELFARGQYNFGDIRMFSISRKHRNDFLKYGRHTLAPNIRAMLNNHIDRYHAPLPTQVKSIGT